MIHSEVKAASSNNPRDYRNGGRGLAEAGVRFVHCFVTHIQRWRQSASTAQ